MRVRSLGLLAAAVLLAPASAAFAQDDNGNPLEAADSMTAEVTPGPAPEGLTSDSPAADVIPPVADHVFELGASKGFVSQRTDDATRSIDVTWKGEIPSEVQAYADSSPHGVRISITSGAKLSRVQGNAACARLVADPAARELGVVSASVNADGSGLTLGVTRATISDADRATLAGAAGLDPSDITVNTGRRANEGYPVRFSPSPESIS